MAPGGGSDAVALVRAANPGPLTLEGTNTWLVGRDPTWVIDPGPDLADHVVAVADVVAARGGLGGVLLTHAHHDHLGALAGLLSACDAADAPVGSAIDPERIRAAGGSPRRLGEGDVLGPARVLATPGHALEHLAFLHEDPGGVEAFTGDAVLGRGSVFVGPFPGAMTGYLTALEALRAERPARLRPGHGPTVAGADVDAHLAGYLAHRREREAALRAALAAGARSVAELLDAAWPEVGPELRGPAALTLEAHLGRLAEAGEVPAGVERPDYAEVLRRAEP